MTSFEVNSETGRDVRRELAAAVVRQGWGLLELRPLRMSLEEIFLHLTTGPAARRTARWRCMNNILAIAHKELKGYFASPIAYVVIGFSRCCSAGSSSTCCNTSTARRCRPGRASRAAGGNVNEKLISPLFLNVSVILLFTLPMITMRTYAEEKRSGTIELLLTSPLTDFQIVMGKFLGGLVLYAAMLAVTLVHMACCSPSATRNGGRSPPGISGCC